MIYANALISLCVLYYIEEEFSSQSAWPIETKVG